MFNTAATRHLAAAAALMALTSGPALAANVLTDNFSSFLVFGDSLSDNGNLFSAVGAPASPPYFDGRFSDGPVWNEAIIESFSGLGRVGANFAFGGARANEDADGIPDFGAQVGLFSITEIPTLGGPAALPTLIGDRPLASVWFGANDLFDSIGVSDPFAAATTAAGDIGTNIGLLNDTFGINDFVVFNLPDLGSIPLFAGGPAEGLATAATDTFNSALSTEILSLQADGINIIEVDVNSLFDDLLADPAAFGVSDTTSVCVISDGDGNVVQNCFDDLGQQAAEEANAERVFFDLVHPTQQIHTELNSQFTSAVAAAIPLPAPAFLLLGALGVFAASRRRRAAN
ncbi:MAG: SGNH/GDSL hydrolase family protein [Pseudomonadota bacterium]